MRALIILFCVSTVAFGQGSKGVTVKRSESGSIVRNQQDKNNEIPSFLDFNAVADGVIALTCSVTNGSNVISCPTASFNVSHVGKLIACNRCLASGGVDNAPDTIVGTIASIISGTSVHASFNSQRTEAGTVKVAYGTDNYTLVSSAINNTTSETIVPGGAGIYLWSGNLPFRSGLTLDCRGSNAVLVGVNPINTGIFVDAKKNATIRSCMFQSISSARHSENSSATIWVGSSAVDAHLLANTVVPGGTPTSMDVHILGVTINGGHGILIGDQSLRTIVEESTIGPTLADGINNASGATHTSVRNNKFYKTGDDSWSSTSYDNDIRNAGNIQYWEALGNTSVDSNANGFREAGGYYSSVHDNIIINPRATCGAIGIDPAFSINQASITPWVKNNHCFAAQGAAYPYIQGFLVHDTIYATVDGNTADSSSYWQLYNNPGLVLTNNVATNSLGSATHAMVVTNSSGATIHGNSVKGSSGGCFSFDSLVQSKTLNNSCQGATGSISLGVFQITNSTDIDGDNPAITGTTGSSIGDFVQSGNTRSTATVANSSIFWVDHTLTAVNIGCTDAAHNCGRAGAGLNTTGTVYLSGASAGLSGDGFSARLYLRSGVWDAYAAAGMLSNVATGNNHIWQVNAANQMILTSTSLTLASGLLNGQSSSLGLQSGVAKLTANTNIELNFASSVLFKVGVSSVASMNASGIFNAIGLQVGGVNVQTVLTAGTGINIGGGIVTNTAPFPGCAAPITSPALCTNVGCSATATITYVPSC